MDPYAASSGKEVKVWLYRPKHATPDAKVVFLMHGADRNAEEGLNCWIDISETTGMIAVAPEFSFKNFGASPQGYNLGNVVSVFGFKNGKSKWAFSVIENIFDQLRNAGLTSTSYSMFGHSAGAQFIHRMLIFLPDARTDVAIAANAGYYTFPIWKAKFPYGLRGCVVKNTDLERAFSNRLIVLLGGNDNDENHPELRRSKEAMAQGAHRLERGMNYCASAETGAKEIGIELKWELAVVPNAGHSYREMSEAAVDYLLCDS